jgi:MoxR-like ATPase
MFSFLKQIMQPIGVRERALKIFSGIEGLDDIKEMLLRALELPERAHTLLIGPPACAKSLFMLEMEKLMRSKLYIA